MGLPGLKARAALAVQDARLLDLSGDVKIAERIYAKLHAGDEFTTLDRMNLKAIEARIEGIKAYHAGGGANAKKFQILANRFADKSSRAKLLSDLSARRSADLVVTINPNMTQGVFSHFPDAVGNKADGFRRAAFIGENTQAGLNNLLTQVKNHNFRLENNGAIPNQNPIGKGRAPLGPVNGAPIKDIYIDLSPERLPEGMSSADIRTTLAPIVEEASKDGINIRFSID
jgi:hypothetical protein